MSPEVYGLWFAKFSLLEDSGKTLTLVCDCLLYTSPRPRDS